ncbi:MAG: N-acetyltransferase [Chitinophagales bacterium]|nr:N-acetyltransferase [Chitinophagaceae bacterium]MCB9065236.1 N-acetyltransferase [Chitinophagales bacterium]
MNEYSIRFIKPEDAQRVLDIYAPYITKSNISFEYEVPTIEEWQQRIATITAQYPWLVCEHEGVIVGYAYAGQHRARTAYQWSVESAIYIAEDFLGKGAGKLLYQKLFELLRQQGYVNVFAGMTLPNEKSEGLHKSCGFETIGVFRNIGYKNNRWHDVQWMQLDLQEHRIGMNMPVSISALN